VKKGGQPYYSIVTTCKGRLDDLKQSLPRFIAQADAEVIVVDYDCPQQCGEFASKEFPAAKVVKVADRPKFNAPEAHNLGAKAAKGEVLVFLDADVLVSPGFLAAIELPMDEAVYGAFKGKMGNSVRGSCFVRRQDFDAIDGYDELLSGYEGEDLDLYMRLRLLGVRRIELDDGGIETVIEQTLEERLLYRRPNIKLQFLRSQLYQLAKEALMRAQGITRIDLPVRKTIMGNVDRQLVAVFKGEQDFELTIELPDRYKRGMLKEWEFSTSVGVKARRKANP